jgi:hypothetical protein
MDKINERKAQQEQKTNGYIKQSTIKMRWKDGKNPVRLVGNYIETHMHSISPSSFGSIGVAPDSNFKGKGALPFEVSCTDWNLRDEQYHKEKTCPFCKLAQRARTALKRKDLSDEEKKLFEKILAANKVTKKLKWNLIDRNAPYYYKVNSGKEEEVKGLKIADVSFSMFEDIKGIIEQNGLDITDENTGIDILIIKGDQDGRVRYSVQPLLEKTSVKVSPMTAEEKSWKQWNFIEMYDKAYDFTAIKSKMHEEFRIILDMGDDEFAESISVSEAHNDDDDADVADSKKK